VGGEQRSLRGTSAGFGVTPGRIKLNGVKPSKAHRHGLEQSVQVFGKLVPMLVPDTGVDLVAHFIDPFVPVMWVGPARGERWSISSSSANEKLDRGNKLSL
jgi:hypothetical protein